MNDNKVAGVTPKKTVVTAKSKATPLKIPKGNKGHQSPLK